MKSYPITQQAKEMFEAYSSYVYGIALMVTKQNALADDITQETFLRAFAKYHLYDDSRPLRPWLYRPFTYPKELEMIKVRVPLNWEAGKA